jgi:DNA-binding NtrC family response regulator
VETFHLKEFVNDEAREGKVISNSEKPIDYKLTICASCIYEGNIPVVLTSSDFKKRSILEELEEETANHESEKKKNNEQNKVADAIEKNKFKIKKTAEQLKMSTEHVFRVLMTMPIQKLEKISRIEPETDAEKEDSPSSKVNVVVNGVEE